MSAMEGGEGDREARAMAAPFGDERWKNIGRPSIVRGPSSKGRTEKVFRPRPRPWPVAFT
jgi:hypothetical protein